MPDVSVGVWNGSLSHRLHQVPRGAGLTCGSIEMEGARCLQDPTLWGAGGSGRQGPSAGVTALANLLQIQHHDDYLVMLKAIGILA